MNATILDHPTIRGLIRSITIAMYSRAMRDTFALFEKGQPAHSWMRDISRYASIDVPEPPNPA
jgi:hypothetical protein